MRIDLDQIIIGGRPLTELILQFAGQLKEIRSSLENRDFVSLGDVLIYETEHTDAQWRLALEELRRMIGVGAAS